LKPDYLEVRNDLAASYIEQGLLSKALKEYQDIIKINPAVSQAYNSLGNIYLLQKKFMQAIKEYEMALKLNHNNVETYYNLAIAYEKTGERQRAVQNYRTFIERAPREYGGTVEVAKKRLDELSSE
jgi:tetratricopeptide (TPR) repeat protein